MSSGGDYRSHINGLIRSAEMALAAPDANNRYQLATNAAPATNPIASYYTGTLTSLDENVAAMTQSEMSRQLRVCMKEIAALRTELSAEREGRNALVQLFGKRIKEELLVEVGKLQHEVRRDVREVEAAVSARLQEAEAAKALDRRKLEDALRVVKASERQRFDAAEQLRDGIDDMRVRVDNAVALCASTRTETAQLMERERSQLQHRLDVELLRYAELNRAQQAAMADTKASVAKEVAEVGVTVRGLVEAAWDERMRGVNKLINDSIGQFRDTQEKHTKVVVDLGGKVETFVKDAKHDLSSTATELRERLATLETTQPLLAARVDRFERKADMVMESNNKMAAHVDALKEMADKAAVQAQRSSDRAQKVEDTVVDRDARILALESQAVAIAGIERLRADAEATKRAVTRIENQMEAVKATADRDERLVETMQRSIEASLERGDAIEKKAHRVVARVETAEQRLMGFLDRVIALETASEQLTVATERSDAARDAVAQRVDGMDQRLRTTAERTDAALRELRDQVSAAAARIESVAEASANGDGTAVSARRDVERLDRKVAKLEAALANSLDNVREMREALGEQHNEVQQVKKRSEQWRAQAERHEKLLEGKQGETDTLSASLQDRVSRSERKSAQLVEAAERRLDEQVSALARKVDELSVAAAKRQHDAVLAVVTGRGVTSAGGAGVGPSGASVGVDDQIALEVAANRRKADQLEHRVRALEATTATQEAEAVKRHELSALRGLITGVEATVSVLQSQVASVAATAVAAASAAASSASYAAPAATVVAARPRPDAVTPQPKGSAAGVGSGATGFDSSDSEGSPFSFAPTSGGSPIPTTQARKVAEAPTPSLTSTTTATTAITASSHAKPVEQPASVVEAKSVGTTASSPVSSIHGVKPSDMNFDESDEEGAEAPAVGSKHGGAAAAGSNAPTPLSTTRGPAGLPPLHSEPAPSTTTALSPKLWQNTRRTPYSDTSGSDIERSAEKSPPAGGGTAAATLAEPQALRQPSPDAAATGVQLPAAFNHANSFGSMVESEELLTPDANAARAFVARPATVASAAAPTVAPTAGSTPAGAKRNPFDSSTGTSANEDDSPPNARTGGAAYAAEAELHHSSSSDENKEAVRKGLLAAQKKNPFASATLDDSDRDAPSTGVAGAHGARPAPAARSDASGARAAQSSDDELALPALSGALGRERESRKFVATDDSSSAVDAGAGRAGVAERLQELPKKFHHTRDETVAAATAGGGGGGGAVKPRSHTSFDDSDDNDSDNGSGGGGVPGDAVEPFGDDDASPGSRSRSSKATSRRSAASRRTADVSLSLETETVGSHRTGGGGSRRAGGGGGVGGGGGGGGATGNGTGSMLDDELDDVEEIEDDDKLAELMGMMTSGKKK